LGAAVTSALVGSYWGRQRVCESRTKIARLMATELTDIRVALIYVETILDVLTGELMKPGCQYLGDPFSYAAKFDQTNHARSADVEPPWRHKGGRSFWSYYFSEMELDTVDGHLAWRSVTPFRHRFPLQVEQPDRARLAPEAFVYPHGTAVIFNLTLTGSYSLDQAATELIALRLDKQFQIKGQSPIVMDALAGEALTNLRRACFGENLKRASRPQGPPFSVLSVARGSGVNPSVPPKQGGEEQLFLDAVTTWSRTWKNAAMPSLDKATIPIRMSGTPPSHLLYAHDHSRAIWFPASFSDSWPTTHTVNCFHRNLVLASLQVESLANFAVATAGLLGGQLTNPHYDAARRSTDVLGRFYGAARSIYRSRSPQAQMDQGGYVSDINAVRGAVQRPALFVPS
jgi:hypothetical protein